MAIAGGIHLSGSLSTFCNPSEKVKKNRLQNLLEINMKL
jgi:hypothetical protein